MSQLSSPPSLATFSDLHSLLSKSTYFNNVDGTLGMGNYEAGAPAIAALDSKVLVIGAGGIGKFATYFNKQLYLFIIFSYSILFLF